MKRPKYIPSHIKTEGEKRAFERGVEAGVKHANPSEETLIMFEKIEGQFKVANKFHVDILNETKKHNSRMTKMELWRAKIDGITLATKGISKGLWTVFGVFFIAGVFSFFQMYGAIKELPVAISNEVEKQLETYEINIIELR